MTENRGAENEVKTAAQAFAALAAEWAAAVLALLDLAEAKAVYVFRNLYRPILCSGKALMRDDNALPALTKYLPDESGFVTVVANTVIYRRGARYQFRTNRHHPSPLCTVNTPTVSAGLGGVSEDDRLPPEVTTLFIGDACGTDESPFMSMYGIILSCEKEKGKGLPSVVDRTVAFPESLRCCPVMCVEQTHTPRGTVVLRYGVQNDVVSGRNGTNPVGDPLFYGISIELSLQQFKRIHSDDVVSAKSDTFPVLSAIRGVTMSDFCSRGGYATSLLGRAANDVATVVFEEGFRRGGALVGPGRREVLSLDVGRAIFTLRRDEQGIFFVPPPKQLRRKMQSAKKSSLLEGSADSIRGEQSSVIAGYTLPPVTVPDIQCVIPNKARRMSWSSIETSVFDIGIALYLKYDAVLRELYLPLYSDVDVGLVPQQGVCDAVSGRLVFGKRRNAATGLIVVGEFGGDRAVPVLHGYGACYKLGPDRGSGPILQQLKIGEWRNGFLVGFGLDLRHPPDGSTETLVGIHVPPGSTEPTPMFVLKLAESGFWGLFGSIFPENTTEETLRVTETEKSDSCAETYRYQPLCVVTTNTPVYTDYIGGWGPPRRRSTHTPARGGTGPVPTRPVATPSSECESSPTPEQWGVPAGFGRRYSLNDDTIYEEGSFDGWDTPPTGPCTLRIVDNRSTVRSTLGQHTLAAPNKKRRHAEPVEAFTGLCWHSACPRTVFTRMSCVDGALVPQRTVGWSVPGTLEAYAGHATGAVQGTKGVTVRRHGHGAFTSFLGLRYRGAWRADRVHGQGVAGFAAAACASGPRGARPPWAPVFAGRWQAGTPGGGRGTLVAGSVRRRAYAGLWRGGRRQLTSGTELALPCGSRVIVGAARAGRQRSGAGRAAPVLATHPEVAVLLGVARRTPLAVAIDTAGVEASLSPAVIAGEHAAFRAVCAARGLDAAADLDLRRDRDRRAKRREHSRTQQRGVLRGFLLGQL